MRIEYNGKGQIINIVVDDHESFMIAIDLIRQIAMDQPTEEKNLEFLNELNARMPKEVDIVGLFDDDIETMDDLDELIDLTMYDNSDEDEELDLELWLDVEDDDDDTIESDDDEFNIPRYVDVSDQAQIDYWNEVIDNIAANPSDRYVDTDDLVCTPPEIDPDYDDAIEIPVIIDDVPQVNLLAKIRVECPDCHEFTMVDPLATTFACEHCDKAQFATKGHVVHTYHCPMCDKMNMISVCGEGTCTYIGECSECNDCHLVVIKSDGTVEFLF